MTPLLAKDERPPRELAPTGLVAALCVLVEDMGYEDFQGDKNFKRKVWVGWELAHKMADDRPFMLSNNYTLTMNEKGNLRRDAEGWLGRPLTDDEIEQGYDVEGWKGQMFTLQVIHKKTDKGDLFAKVGAVLPAQGDDKLSRVVEAVPDWVKERQASNPKDRDGSGGSSSVPF